MVCAVYVVVGHGCLRSCGTQVSGRPVRQDQKTRVWGLLSLGGGSEVLPGSGPVDMQVAEGFAVRAVDGDVVAVEEHGDFAAGVGSADGDHSLAGQADVAVGEDGEDLDLRVVSNRELAGPAEGWGVVPGLLWGLVPGAVTAAGVVPVLVAIARCLELGDGRWWLLLQPFLEGLVESFDLAAGLRVVGPGVPEADATLVQGDLEGDAARGRGIGR